MTIWNLLFYVDLDTSSKIKLIFVPTHNYWSIPFSAVNSVFFHFSHVCQIYVAEVLIIHFLQILPSKVLSLYECQSEVNFGGLGVNSRSRSSPRSIFVLYLLKVHSISGSNPIYVSPKIMLGGQLWLQLQFHLCPTCTDCVGSTPKILE